MEAEASATLRVATWNIHGCIGHDRVFAPHRSLAVIGELRADILALQEVDSRFSRSSGLDTFTYFKSETGLHSFEARVFGGEDGHYGHMVLSRWPILRGRTHDVSTARREPRMVIDITVAVPARPVRVLAAHLGLGVMERRFQIRTLRDIVESAPDETTIILGDFNEVRRRGMAYRAFATRFTAAKAWATFPAHRPLLPLDRIWCSQPFAMARTWVHLPARHVSDHLPLVAELTCMSARQAEEAGQAVAIDPEAAAA